MAGTDRLDRSWTAPRPPPDAGPWPRPGAAAPPPKGDPHDVRLERHRVGAVPAYGWNRVRRVVGLRARCLVHPPRPPLQSAHRGTATQIVTPGTWRRAPR